MPEDMKPTIVTVADTRGSGASGQVIETGHPVVIHAVAPWKIILVRALKTGLDTFNGGLTGSTLASITNLASFSDVFTVGLWLVLGSTLASAGRNTYEYLAQWDQKHPTFTA